jgi:RNA polymerase sigma-70 factor (ECF subfamily)
MIDYLSPSEVRVSSATENVTQIIGELRPQLHRYCARLVGSVVDGEDIVQESILKALEALAKNGTIANPEGWLFRIAHNSALDFLRQRSRQTARHSEREVDTIADPNAATDRADAAAATLRTFMRLPMAYRSTVILKDVLGYSVQEIGDITEMGVPAVKSALHRGRLRLREIAQEPVETRVPTLDQQERLRLTNYVERFNARDFDAVRDLLAEDVQLEMVNKTRMKGRIEVGRYFGNYTRLSDWTCVPGWVEQRPAIIVKTSAMSSNGPAYFILLSWSGDHVTAIRDFAHARYVVEGADIIETM